MDKKTVDGTKTGTQPRPIQEDIQGRVNQLLRQADEKVKAKRFEEALRLVRNVYTIDVKNMYARAYEERILTIKIEEERGRVTEDAERKANEKIESELKRRMNEFYKSMQMETLRKKQLESKEQNLEDQARQVSVAEQQEIVQKGMAALETNMKTSIEDLERRLAYQVQRAVGMGGVALPGSMLSVDQVRAQYESELAQMKQQYEEAETALRAIHQETFSKMAEENQRARDELVHQMDEQREELVQREKERTKQISLEAYKTLLASMEQLGVHQSLHDPLLQALRIPFSISEEEHHNLKRRVHLDLYISVLRGAWQKGRPTGEDVVNLKSLQALYGLSDEEHLALTRSAKKDLGLPDDTAVILVVDDDPVVQKFIGHILKRTYSSVLSVTSVDEAIKAMSESLPSLILCDLHMGPDSISGVTLYERIQQGEYGDAPKAVPFVLMSALRDEFFVKSAKSLGIKTFLPKPFSKESLEHTVKEALS